jgi:hypothetical protein
VSTPRADLRILIGFRPQPYRTFKLLWNALYLSGLEETDL